jgi:hypothetical protein
VPETDEELAVYGRVHRQLTTPDGQPTAARHGAQHFRLAIRMSRHRPWYVSSF